MRYVVISTVVLTLLGAPGPAQHASDHEFTQTGIPPSAFPDITLFNNTGFVESSLYTVAGGLLQQRTFSINGNASYVLLKPGRFENIEFSPSLGTVLEARLQVLAINGQAGSFFQASDGMHRYGIWFTPTGLDILTTNDVIASVPVDVFQFHTYRIESPPDSDVIEVFVDGMQVFSGHAAATSLFFANWGDGKTSAGNGADTDWDYVRFTNGASVYEPFGQGCAGSNGTPSLTSVGGQVPVIGQPFDVQVANLLPATPAGLVVGFSNSTWNGMALPLNLTAPFRTGCTQYLSLDFIFGAMSDMSGVATWSLPLLNSPSLVGVGFYLQAAAIDTGPSLVVTNAAEGVIGMR